MRRQPEIDYSGSCVGHAERKRNVKKILLTTTALIALGIAPRPPPISPPGPTPRRRRWRLRTTGAASTPALTAAGDRPQALGRDQRSASLSRRAATTQPAAPSVVRSATAGRSARGCSASKPRATGPTSGQQCRACLLRLFTNDTMSTPSALFTGQVGYAVEQRPVLRQGRRRRGLAIDTVSSRPAPASQLANSVNHTRWGWHRRRRRGIWLRPELVGRHEYNHMLPAGHRPMTS